MDTSTGAGRLLAVLLAGAALLLAGCSTGNASAGPGVRSTVRASSSGLASPSATPSTSAGPASCKAGKLSVVLEHARAARGATHYPIEFMNMSLAPCTLHGFPDVAFFGENNSVQVGSAARRNHGSTEHLITLPPEGFAIAQVSVANAKMYPRGCRQTKVSGILVHPPGLTTSIRLSLSGLTCANRRYHVLTVNAVAQGQAAVGD